MRTFILLSLFASALAPRSCEEADSLKEGSPIALSAPQFVVPGANFAVVVNFEGGTNGCAKAHSLTLQGSDTLKVVKAYYVQEEIEGQLCATVMPVHELTINDTAPAEGQVRYVDVDGRELGRVTVRKAPTE